MSDTDPVTRLNRALEGRYRIDREVGEGAMATVYLADDIKHERSVALKVLKPELAAVVGAERFLAEIKTTANLQHPHILPLYDSGEADGFLYYVMPYVEGETLRGRLEREIQLPVEDMVRIVSQVADALSYAHHQGIIHRDVKPENILLSAGHARLADFGIARAVTSVGGARLTQTGLAVGTPIYLSPEQASSDHNEDGRTDTYSLGCVAYEMLAGAPPYTGPTAQAILVRKSVEPVPSVRVLRETVPLGVDEAITQALAKVPADRFQTVEEFSEALARGLTAGADVQALSRPSRTRWAVGATLLVLAAASWGVWSTISSGDAGIRSLAVLPLTNLSGDPEDDYFVAGVHDALTSRLAQLGGLRVISRTSALRYRDAGKSLPEIARELNVEGIVEGSVLRAGDVVQLSIRLIEAFPDERLRWARDYEATVPNVFALYGEVAVAIADAAEVPLTTAEARRLGSQRELDPDAQDAYLRGKYQLSRSTPEGVQRGLDYLQEAVDLDPTDPRPWSALALAYVAIGHSGVGSPDAFLRAKAAAERALALDDTEVEAYLALADVYMYEDWNWEGAGEAFERALELSPNHADLRYHYSWYRELFLERDQAIAQMERAKALDPLAPANTAWLGYFYALEGRYDEAAQEAESALQLAPDFWVSHLVLGVVNLDQGHDEEALGHHRRLAESAPYFRGLLGPTLAVTGRAGEARRLAQELERDPTEFDLLALTFIYASLGDLDAAFEWMERCFASPHAFLPWIRYFPYLEPLRDDPRFQDVLERLRLPSA